jgi:hypothetical protein
MDLPIKFPSDEEVIAEEVARFRALSSEERVRCVHGLVALGDHLMRISPKADFARAYTLQQEEQNRQAIREFVARHAA